MGKLGRRLADALDEAANSTPPAEPARVEWNPGDGTGTIFTGAVGDDFDPNDAAAVLTAHGFNPDTHTVELTSAKRWEQRNRIRGTSDYERQWLHSFAYKVAQRQGADIDLPALYAEARRTRPAKPAKRPKTGDATVVVAWADVQTGKVDRLGGVTELLERLDAKRANLEAYLKRSDFDHIVIADCGDILEGFDNVASQIRTNGLSLQDQVDIAATEFWRTIKLCERYAPVDVLSIPSNHCQWRNGGKSLAGKPGDDWGLHISQRLEALAGEVGLRVTFHRPADPYDEVLQFDVRGTRLGLAHGHQARNPDGVKTWWQRMTHAGVLDCAILLTGHFHFASLRPHGRDATTGRARWHIQAPTLDNGSAWVRNQYGEDGDPALAVFQISPDGFDLTSFALL